MELADQGLLGAEEVGDDVALSPEYSTIRNLLPADLWHPHEGSFVQDGTGEGCCFLACLGDVPVHLLKA